MKEKGKKEENGDMKKNGRRSLNQKVMYMPKGWEGQGEWVCQLNVFK